jgi:transketolase
MNQAELDQLCISTLRFVAVDRVQNPNSGHPGMPLNAAPMAGAEVSLIVAAEPILRERGIRTRLVSMSSWELFAQQSAAYRESVLPRTVKARLAVEAARSFGWVGFGASAPREIVLRECGFTVDSVVERALEVSGRQS